MKVVLHLVTCQEKSSCFNQKTDFEWLRTRVKVVYISVCFTIPSMQGKQIIHNIYTLLSFSSTEVQCNEGKLNLNVSIFSKSGGQTMELLSCHPIAAFLFSWEKSSMSLALVLNLRWFATTAAELVSHLADEESVSQLLRQCPSSALSTGNNIFLLAHLSKCSFIRIRVWPLLNRFTTRTYSVLSPTRKSEFIKMYSIDEPCSSRTSPKQHLPNLQQFKQSLDTVFLIL